MLDRKGHEMNTEKYVVEIKDGAGWKQVFEPFNSMEVASATAALQKIMSPYNIKFRIRVYTDIGQGDRSSRATRKRVLNGPDIESGEIVKVMARHKKILGWLFEGADPDICFSWLDADAEIIERASKQPNFAGEMAKSYLGSH